MTVKHYETWQPSFARERGRRWRSVDSPVEAKR